MSKIGPAPPPAEEIDVESGGTKIAGQAVTPQANGTQINPKAIGPIDVVGNVVQFAIVQLVNGLPATIWGISSITIPFGSNSLNVANVNGRAVWKLNGGVLTAYGDRTSRNWPASITTPSGTSVSYTKDGASHDLPFAQFSAMQIRIQQP